ncbi:hypothetical protein ABBQ32_002344 [Trebouxia sp. C0010 RCD-2024]
MNTYASMYAMQGALAGKEGPERVVLKRVKQRVEGAEEMAQMEHLLNVYASRVAKDSIADFVGYVEVAEDEATTRLTQGVWLMWRYQGHKTLAHYLKRRDCLTALSEDLGVKQSAVVATVMKQLLENIAALHNAGLVHRDVKPMNIIFAEDEKSFKLIDLGACADLRSGTNYIPDESILDPTYCPPEQLALGKVRSGSGLKAFNTALESVDYDLSAWRRRANLSSKDTAILDADDSAGWELAEALLRPRSIEVDEESGAVKFVNTNHEAVRLSVSLALTHKFIKQAQRASSVATSSRQRAAPFGRSLGRSVSKGTGDSSGSTTEQAAAVAAAMDSEATAPTSSKGGMFGMAVGVWRKATSKLFDLEAKIANQTSAVATQTTRVQRLEVQAATGKVSVARLEQEQGVLSKMTGRLAGLTAEFNSTAQSANRLLGSLMNRGRGKAASDSPVPSATLEGLAQEVSEAPRQASPRSDMPPSLHKRSHISTRSQTAREQQEEPTAEDQTGPSSRGQAGSPRRAPRAVQEQFQPSRTEPDPPRPTKRKVSRQALEKHEPAPESSQGKAAGAGVNMLYAGLKFTGLALSVAGGLAKAVRQDAERMVKELEADAAAKKLSKETAAAFVDLLRQAQPEITSQTTFGDIQGQCAGNERWQALSEDKRRQVFDTYLAAVVKMEAAAHQRAVADFKVMLNDSDIGPDSQWSTVRSQLSSLAAFSAVRSQEERQQLFQEYVTDLQAAADRAAAIAVHEEDFQHLLETRDPPLTPQSSWPALRRQISQDPRYTALPERRCRQLFNQYHSTLKDLQSAPATSPPSTTPATASSSTGDESLPPLTPEEAGKAASALWQLSEQLAASSRQQAPTEGAQLGPGQDLAELAQPNGAQAPSAGDSDSLGQQSVVQLDALEALRQEQARLKAEYDRMEAKLLEMEARLRMKEAGEGTSSTPRSAVVSGNGAFKANNN